MITAPIHHSFPNLIDVPNRPKGLNEAPTGNTTRGGALQANGLVHPHPLSARRRGDEGWPVLLEIETKPLTPPYRIVD